MYVAIKNQRETHELYLHHNSKYTLTMPQHNVRVKKQKTYQIMLWPSEGLSEDTRVKIRNLAAKICWSLRYAWNNLHVQLHSPSWKGNGWSEDAGEQQVK